MTFQDGNSVTRITPATKILQSIANKGEVDAAAVQQAQTVIDENPAIRDLGSFFETHCTEIKNIIEKSKTQDRHDDLIESLSSSFANFRSAIVMSDDPRISDILSQIFFLVEGIETIDSDICEILEIYILAVRAILRLENAPANIIRNIEGEMKAAVNRYIVKHPEISVESAIDNENLIEN